MYTTLSYQQLLPTGRVLHLGDNDSIAGSYKSKEMLIAAVKYPKAYKSLLEWFASSSFDTVKEIVAFTERYGLLRANFTHEGQGGSKSATYNFPVERFRESHREFQEEWTRAEKHTREVGTWLSKQLASESSITEIDRPEDIGKGYQPRLSVQVNSTSTGLIVRLVLGDLWQALCCELLQTLTEKHEQIRECKEGDRCDGTRYFVTSDHRKIFCSKECARRNANRNDMRRKRARQRRQGKYSTSKGRNKRKG